MGANRSALRLPIRLDLFFSPTQISRHFLSHFRIDFMSAEECYGPEFSRSAICSRHFSCNSFAFGVQMNEIYRLLPFTSKKENIVLGKRFHFILLLSSLLRCIAKINIGRTRAAEGILESKIRTFDNLIPLSLPYRASVGLGVPRAFTEPNFVRLILTPTYLDRTIKHFKWRKRASMFI